MDVIERDDKYLLRADVPGFRPDEVNKDRYLRRERRYGSACQNQRLSVC